jgi:hypothetical protein
MDAAGSVRRKTIIKSFHVNSARWLSARYTSRRYATYRDQPLATTSASTATRRSICRRDGESSPEDLPLVRERHRNSRVRTECPHWHHTKRDVVLLRFAVAQDRADTSSSISDMSMATVSERISSAIGGSRAAAAMLRRRSMHRRPRAARKFGSKYRHNKPDVSANQRRSKSAWPSITM